MICYEAGLISDRFWTIVRQCCKQMSSAPYRPHWEKKRKKKSALPDRWDKYVPYGKPIPNSRFIAFKVPLKAHVAVPERDGSLFTPDHMLKSFAADNIDVGLIVDLTFTSKYYGRDVIDDLFGGHDIAHHKILTEGHEIPKFSHVRNFQTAVGEFFDRDPHRLVGVHCTHGLNRTGYMVCRYLIERLGWNPDEAIAAFDEARGHTQERQNYLDDLRALGNGNGGGGGAASKTESGDATGKSMANPSSSSTFSSQGVGERKGGVWDRLGPETSIPKSIGVHEGISGHRESVGTSDAPYRRRDEGSWRQRGSYAQGEWRDSERQRPRQQLSNQQRYDRGSHTSHYSNANGHGHRSHDDRHHPYDQRFSNGPTFQPYQRLDPYRVDHRKMGAGRDPYRSSKSRDPYGSHSNDRSRYSK